MLVIKHVLLLCLLIIYLPSKSNSKNHEITILGIEPYGGPTAGGTRVTVRLDKLTQEMMDEYPEPKCRSGSTKYIVIGTYVKCTPYPLKIGEFEAPNELKTEMCIQCGDLKPHTEDIVPFTVSLLGDFTDVVNSVSYTFYKQPNVTWIYPRYGPKDGFTFVEVYGDGFLNFDQNLRCTFGSKTVKANIISKNKITCISPESDVVDKEIPFGVTLNNQQVTQDKVSYVYYNFPQVAKLKPNRGPEFGGTRVRILGQFFKPMVEITTMGDVRNDTYCQFGDLPKKKAEVISSTEIICYSPPYYDPNPIPVEITLNNRNWTIDKVPFQYYRPPIVYSLTPNIGPVSGGTKVLVTGTNFEDTGKVYCRYGSDEKVNEGTFIDTTHLYCTTPPMDTVDNVAIQVATREGEYSSENGPKFRFYDNPIISHIEPICGPESGFTQISVFGKNFPQGYNEIVKCVFDKKIRTNVTVFNDGLLKCDSPSVLNHAGINEKKITNYTLDITVGTDELNGPTQRFYYYKDPLIQSITPVWGPVQGGTSVNITGTNFNQKTSCNITVRFTTYPVKPIIVNNTYMILKTPKANYVGAADVQIALNGRDFVKDVKIGARETGRTFYYYRDPFTLEMKPKRGNVIGNTLIKLNGVGYNDPFTGIAPFANELPERKIYYKFENYDKPNEFLSNVSENVLIDNLTIAVFSPPVSDPEIRAKVLLSYNNENFFPVNIPFNYYISPNIIEIDPKEGSLKKNSFDQINVILDKYVYDENDDILCKFESESGEFIEKGDFYGDNIIKCNLPKVSIADVYVVELSFREGIDYTNNKKTFTFFDPQVIKIIPSMCSSDRESLVEISGTGFANSSNLKVKLGNDDIKCGNSSTSCLLKAEFKSPKSLLCKIPPKSKVKYINGTDIEDEKIPVEVSIDGKEFTNNSIGYFYFDSPEFRDDVENCMDFDYLGEDVDDVVNNYIDEEENNETETKEITPQEKKITKKELKDLIKTSLIKDLPVNIHTYIPVPICKIKNFKKIEPYCDYKCRYQIKGKDGQIETKIVPAIFTSFPKENPAKNLFLCKSPVWDKIGSTNAEISLNGFDFYNSSVNLQMKDPMEILKLEPPCGPTKGNTEVDIYGTGLDSQKEYVYKWGPQNLVPMENNLKFTTTEEEESVNLPNSEFKITKMKVLSPQAPDYIKTHGGLDYISLTKFNYLPIDLAMLDYYPNLFVHTKYEFYYYHPIYVESFSPHGDIIYGGSKVIVVGAWFQYKPEYGCQPYCDFGGKIVTGKYISNVRISCISPEYDQENVEVPFGVSLNGKDFYYPEKKFRYYGDFSKSKFQKIIPRSGPCTGGTEIKIYGKQLSSISENTILLNRFKNVFNLEVEPKDVPGQLKVINKETDESVIICKTPGTDGYEVDNVTFSFDSDIYLPTGFNFTFYKIESIKPIAGPNDGSSPITVKGDGLNVTDRYIYNFDNTTIKPSAFSFSRIENPVKSYNENYTGTVNFALDFNGVDIVNREYYVYIQPTITNIFPKSGAAKGKSKIHVFGKNFRNDFPGAELACKAGDFYGTVEFISTNHIICEFDRLPLLETIVLNSKEKNINTNINNNNKKKRNLEIAEDNQDEEEYKKFQEEYGPDYEKNDKNNKKDKNNKQQQSSILPKNAYSLTISLNNNSFTKDKVPILAYGIESIEPASGPTIGGTNVKVLGYGFLQTKIIRCRFGDSVTFGTYLDYNTIICKSPQYTIPTYGQSPFSVPFSISFNNESFISWTESNHYFIFYENPLLYSSFPTEGNTTSITVVTLDFFNNSLLREINIIPTEKEYKKLPDLTKDENALPSYIVEYSFSKENIKCKFGDLGMTDAILINGTRITCLTPKITNENFDYQQVYVEVALNGQDFIKDKKVFFIFKGPGHRDMGWIYALIFLLILILIVILLIFSSSAWSQILATLKGIDYSEEERSKVQNKELVNMQNVNRDNSNNLMQQGDNVMENNPFY